ncbi:MAG: AAA family ATPase [Mucinivorans sp.]
MINSHIATQIYNNFGFQPTLEQKNVINSLSEYISTSNEGDIFIINGYAGTGKTTIIAALVATLDFLSIEYSLLAPTGRAAKVMSQYSGKNAHTIHKKIYRRRSAGASGGTFALAPNKSVDAIFIVDEASMLSNDSFDSSSFGTGCLLDDLLEYINSGDRNRLILVGDNAQLPPVGLDYSPALNGEYMCKYGTVYYHTLKEVVRQAKDSAILLNATDLRSSIEQETVCLPHFELSDKQVVRITGSELIESLEDSYRQVGREDTIIITRSNKRANIFNNGVRARVLELEEQLTAGDMIMIVKNNYYYTAQDKECKIDFIANGDIAIVERVLSHRDIYGFHYASVRLRLPDYDDYTFEALVLLDTLQSESPSLTRDQSSQLFSTIEQDYADIGEKRKRYARIMQNPYFNALQIKFSYAVTCHKAQGGQWQHVYLDQMIFGSESMTRDFQRWLYTALTRARTRLYLINWHDSFFDNPPTE